MADGPDKLAISLQRVLRLETTRKGVGLWGVGRGHFQALEVRGPQGRFESLLLTRRERCVCVSTEPRSQSAPGHRNSFLDTLAFGKAPQSLAEEHVVPVAPGDALESNSHEKV